MKQIPDSAYAHASPDQRRAIDAYRAHGSRAKAGKALGLSSGAVGAAIDRAIRRAAKADPTMHAKQAPPSYHLRGVSTLLDAGGNPVMTWVKTSKDRGDPAAFLEAYRQALADAPIDAAKPVRVPQVSIADLLSVYPMGDPHLGMLAWGPETGQDFDLSIAEENLTSAVDKLVALSPASEHALIVNCGDFVHADNAQAMTMRSGNRLDVDSRWAKMLGVALRAMHRCIDRALEKHKHVAVICEIGNHDDHTAIMLALALAERYRNEPRVMIDTSPSPFHWYEFGACLIGTTHGQAAKPDILPGIMAHDKAEAWGRTRFRYWYVGHYHHTRVREFPGCVVEVFRTLAPADAWAHAAGYRSGRDMIVDVLHRDRGRILRHSVGIADLGVA